MANDYDALLDAFVEEVRGKLFITQYLTEEELRAYCAQVLGAALPHMARALVGQAVRQGDKLQRGD